MSVGLRPASVDALGAWCRFIAFGGAPPPAVPPDGPELDALISVVLANRLGPALDLALARHGAPAASTLVRAARDDARRAAENGLSALVTLRAAAAALDAASIPWLLWKGPALSVQAWGDATRRHFTDLDLVVARASRRAAREALGRAGWRAAGDLPARTERVVHAREAAYPLTHGDAPLVELHWAFGGPVHPQPLDPAAVLARAEQLRVGAVEVRTPAGSDALLLLALHATKHGWSQAEEVLTFARLAARSPDALAGARATAERAGVARALALAERLALRLLGDDWARATGQPDASLARPGAGATRGSDEMGRLTDACLARMCAGDAAWRETHAWTMSWMSRRTDRVRYMAGALFRPTPQESRWLRLPDALAAAYPAVRVARLALRALGVSR